MKKFVPRELVAFCRWIRYRFVYSGVDIFQGAVIGGKCAFERPSKVCGDAVLQSVRMGARSYIGDRARVINANIGRFCSIAPDSNIGGFLHPIDRFVSTCPAFYSSLSQCGPAYVDRNIFEENAVTDLGSDVWVGYRAIILPGIKVGHGAVIGAGAVVTKDVPDYAVVAGVPARVLKYRFDSQRIQHLLASRWWEKDQAWLAKHASSFRNIDEFLALKC
jgi:acetyltransferase-like isoleucine patch superfamily enzyme